MEMEPNQPDKPDGEEVSSVAFMLAFAPGVLVLILVTFLHANGVNISDGIKRLLVWIAFFLSAICCFISSFMFFRRKTASAIFVGIVFVLVNGCISFGLGCCAAPR